MNEVILGITAIICLTILGIFVGSYMPGASKVLYAIVAIIGGIGGHYLPKGINKYRSHLKKVWRR